MRLLERLAHAINTRFWVIWVKHVIIRPMSKCKYSLADVEFRELMKELRLAKGLTQVELARRLCVPQSYVSKYETGERRLDLPETAVVCDAIGVPFSSFVRAYERRRRNNTNDTALGSGGRQ